MSKLKKDIQKELVSPMQQNRLMKLNKLLSSKYVIGTIALAVGVTLFLCGNYLLNVVTGFKYLFSNPQQCLGLISFITIKKENGWFYLIYIICIVFVDLIIIYKFRTAFKDLNIQQKGSERWNTVEEIQKQYRSVPEKTERFEGKGGVPVCWIDNRIYIDDSPVNTIVIGITRAGKGETYTYPTIDIYSRSSEQPSFIVTDMKLDQYPTCYYPLTKRGYDVYLFNLDNPLKSMAYNPIQLMVDEYKEGRESEAELLCQTFCYSIFHKKGMENVREPFFPEGSTNILFCLIWSLLEDNIKKDREINAKNKVNWKKKQTAFGLLSEKEKTAVRDKIETLNIETRQDDLLNFKYIPPEIAYIPRYEYEKKITVPSAINMFLSLVDVEIIQGKKTITALEIYFHSRPVRDKSRLRFASIKTGSANQKGNLYQYMSQQITTYMLDNVAKFTSTNTLRLSDIGFGNKPVAVFLNVPDYDDSLHILASTFIEQVYFVLSKQAARSRNKRCKRDVIFYLEEVGNMPAIKNLESGITMGQSRGLKFVLSVQSYSQIEKIYGKEAAKNIIGNCGNHVYIKTNDSDTAKEFAGMLGDETITNVSRMGGKLSLNKTFTETPENKQLLNPNELMDLEEKCCVIKRTMRRRDLAGNPIPREFPIYNHGKTAFKMRHEYMEDEFPSGVNLDELPAGDNSKIDLEQYTFDVDEFFDGLDKQVDLPLQQEPSGTGGQNLQQIQVTQNSQNSNPINIEGLRTSAVLVSSIPNGQILLNMLENMLHISVDNLTVGEAITELELAEASYMISEQNKANLLSLIAESEIEI